MQKPGMLETKFSQKLCKACKDAGAMVLNIHGHAEQASGWPDLYVSSKTFTGWIELKCYPREVTELQDNRLRRLIDSGEWAMVASLYKDGSVDLRVRFWILRYEDSVHRRHLTLPLNMLIGKKQRPLNLLLGVHMYLDDGFVIREIRNTQVNRL